MKKNGFVWMGWLFLMMALAACATVPDKQVKKESEAYRRVGEAYLLGDFADRQRVFLTQQIERPLQPAMLEILGWRHIHDLFAIMGKTCFAQTTALRHQLDGPRLAHFDGIGKRELLERHGYRSTWLNTGQ